MKLIRANIGEILALGLAAIAILVGTGYALQHHTRHTAPVIPAPKPVADPLVFRRKGNLRIVRAVVGQKLYIIVFEHRAGVWFFVNSRPATELSK